MSLFKTNKEIHNYNTRANKKIHKPMSKTNIFIFYFLFFLFINTLNTYIIYIFTNIRKFTKCNKGVDIYNSLPCQLKENQCSFKRKFKKFILENQK